MERINPFAGIAYGFSLLGYLAAVLGFGLLVSATGAVFLTADQSVEALVTGGLMFLFGVGVTFAGIIGVLYKVISDGVAAGIENAAATSTGRSARETDDGPSRSR